MTTQALTAVLVAMALPLAAPAQTTQSVSGVVTDAASGEPLSAALVSLMGPGERPIQQVMSGPDGRFDLRVPSPGTWRIEVSRLSYRPHGSGDVAVGPGERVRLDVELRSAPLLIDAVAVEVQGEGHCRRLDLDEASLLVRLWEEARTSLRVVQWATAEERYIFQRVTWEREVDLLTERMVERRGQGAFTGSPFVSAPIDTLLEGGWVQPEPGSDAVVWYGPDADALLSGRFREEHCFQLRAHAERSEWIGLAFEPIRRDGPPGIQGVVWIQRETAELIRLEFNYTAHLYASPPIPELLLDLFGGTMEFRTLPDGVVVVDEWSIRMPAFLRQLRGGARAPEITGAPAAHFRRVRDRLPRAFVSTVQEELGFGYREEGGELLRIVTPSGTVFPARGVARVEGTVRDSTSGAFPLAGAEIEIMGTGITRRTGDDGRFLAEVPHGGEFDLRVRHPRLDSLGIEDFTQPVTLFPGERRLVEVGIPSLRTLRVMECGQDPGGTDRAILHGRVLDTSRAGAVAGSRVRVVPENAPPAGGEPAAREVETDGLGRYLFCDLPGGDRYRLSAEWAGVEGDPHGIGLADGAVSEVDLLLGVGSRGIVRGRVLDQASGAPVAGARVVFQGEESRAVLTDAIGEFGLEGILEGPYVLRVEHLAYQDPGLGLEVEGAGRITRIEVRVLPDAIALNPIQVEVEARPIYGVLAAVYDRVDRSRALGLGRIWDRRELDEVVSGNLQHLLLELPGIERTQEGDYISAGAQGMWAICPMVLYLNGTRVEETSPDEFSVRDLEVVEVYRRASEVPAEFAGSWARCGVISLWTRRGY